MCLHEIWRVLKIHFSFFQSVYHPQSGACYAISTAVSACMVSSLKITWAAANLFQFAHNLALSVLGIHVRKVLKVTKVHLSLSFYDGRVASQKGNLKVVVYTSYVFVHSMDCRWIIFIFFLLVSFYLYLHTVKFQK